MPEVEVTDTPERIAAKERIALSKRLGIFFRKEADDPSLPCISKEMIARATECDFDRERYDALYGPPVPPDRPHEVATPSGRKMSGLRIPPQHEVDDTL